MKRRQDGDLVETPINAGSVWHIPPGAWHSVKNTGTSPLVMVFATVPNVEKGLLPFFRRIATIPGQKPTVLGREELARIGAEHDFVLKAVHHQRLGTTGGSSRLPPSLVVLRQLVGSHPEKAHLPDIHSLAV